MTGRKLGLLALLLVFAGCTNLSAVSEFAKLGSDATSSSTAIDRYPSAMKEFVRTAPPGKDPARDEAAANAKDLTKLADEGVKTLSLYLSTLSKLADDKVVDVGPSAKSIGGSLKTLKVLDSKIADPATAIIALLLKAPLDAWRRQAVANLINGANLDVQKLASALADFAQLVSNQYRKNTDQAFVFYRNLRRTTSNVAVIEMLNEWEQYHEDEYAKGRDQALAAEAIFRKIVQAQADLAAHQSDLNGRELKALLSRYSDDIVKASKLLPVP